MAQDKPIYDLTVLLDADAPSERRGEILREVEAMITREGTIESKHEWGVRQLAYQIDHRPDAEYHLLQFSGPPQMIERLRGALKVTDGVLRHRIIRLRPGTPPPPAMRSETRAPVEAPAPAAAAPASGPGPAGSEGPAEGPSAA